MLETHLVRAALVLAHELHFRRAAERLNISVSQLSERISRLEAQLETKLFLRTTRKVEITTAGETFFMEAQRLVDQQERLIASTKRAAKIGMSERIRIGFTAVSLTQDLPWLLDCLAQSFPNVEVVLSEFGLPERYERLMHGELDLMLAMQLPDMTGFDMLPMSVAQPVLVMGPNEPDINPRQIETLRNRRFITYPRNDFPELYDALVSGCHAWGFTPDVVAEVRGFASMIAMIEASRAIGILPLDFTKRFAPHLRYTTFLDDYFPRVPYSLVPQQAVSQVIWRQIQASWAQSAYGQTHHFKPLASL